MQKVLRIMELLKEWLSMKIGVARVKILFGKKNHLAKFVRGDCLN